MLVHTPVTELFDNSARRRGDRPAAHERGLRLRMDFTEPPVAVLCVSGELDAATTPRLAEVLWPRLLTELRALVIDLGDVSFLGVDALRLLAGAHSEAAHRGVALCLTDSARPVRRALAAAGLHDALPCFDDVAAARAALTTAARPVASR
ncbi:STAS domain-containing protein [Saccharopolyspora erythraea]|uniref:STAS domain-containing protein n=1 Tax=Saccharopolyspora erythraea TaxID=1836 RepID=UPI001BA93DFC|nr:STAS domain-containing protein [Saccharopolyspora erythraea]QUH02946.1 STAS domain-containing protein [Saccharopolyspora erythraea]